MAGGFTDENVDNALWRFVLPFYGRDGVSGACLTLQDVLGVDVNILLFAVFAQVERGTALSLDDIATVDALTRAWRREVIQPLRDVRSRMKAGPAPAPCSITDRLRNRIKSVELHAEQIELAVLHAWLDGQRRPVSSTADPPRLVAQYFAGQDTFPADVEAALDTLTQAMRTAGPARAAQSPATNER